MTFFSVYFLEVGARAQQWAGPRPGAAGARHVPRQPPARKEALRQEARRGEGRGTPYRRPTAVCTSLPGPSQGLCTTAPIDRHVPRPPAPPHAPGWLGVCVCFACPLRRLACACGAAAWLLPPSCREGAGCICRRPPYVQHPLRCSAAPHPRHAPQYICFALLYLTQTERCVGGSMTFAHALWFSVQTAATLGEQQAGWGQQQQHRRQRRRWRWWWRWGGVGWDAGGRACEGQPKPAAGRLGTLPALPERAGGGMQYPQRGLRCAARAPCSLPQLRGPGGMCSTAR